MMRKSLPASLSECNWTLPLRQETTREIYNLQSITACGNWAATDRASCETHTLLCSWAGDDRTHMNRGVCHLTVSSFTAAERRNVLWCLTGCITDGSYAAVKAFNEWPLISHTHMLSSFCCMFRTAALIITGVVPFLLWQWSKEGDSWG